MLPYPRWNPYAMTGAGESPRPTVEQIQGEDWYSRLVFSIVLSFSRSITRFLRVHQKKFRNEIIQVYWFYEHMILMCSG